jgi:cytochrome d ubiquinol oxidase subunit I
MMPLGFVATLAGWITAEVGRQPYVVYGLLRTQDSVSPVAAGSVAASLALFVLVYNLLLLAYLYYAFRVALRGPDDVTAELPAHREPITAKRARLQAI